MFYFFANVRKNKVACCPFVYFCKQNKSCYENTCFKWSEPEPYRET